jgi:hypothetical protein
VDEFINLPVVVEEYRGGIWLLRKDNEHKYLAGK